MIDIELKWRILAPKSPPFPSCASYSFELTQNSDLIKSWIYSGTHLETTSIVFMARRLANGTIRVSTWATWAWAIESFVRSGVYIVV